MENQSDAQYCILRTQKLKSTKEVRGSLRHVLREAPTPNADPVKAALNYHTHGDSTSILERFGRLLPKQRRRDAVLAIEYLVTASPEFFKRATREQTDKYFKDAVQWLQNRHGCSNIFHVSIHRDETTEHAHVYVCPRDHKGKLNCKRYLGGKNALSGMQSDFAEKVGVGHGLKRGVQKSRAKHTSVRRFYSGVNRAAKQMAELQQENEQLKKDLKIAENKIEINRKNAANTRSSTLERERRLKVKHQEEITRLNSEIVILNERLNPLRNKSVSQPENSVRRRFR